MLPGDFDLSHRPQGYMALPSEPEFSSSVHLALECPSEIISLSEFGYSEDQVADCPSDFAVTNIFRILSDEGAACLLSMMRHHDPRQTLFFL